MADNPNKNRRCLDISAKLNILRRLDNGESGQTIGRDFGVDRSTISRIKKNRAIIEDYSRSRNMKCKHIMPLANEKLELSVLKFIDQAKENNLRLSGPMIQDKARQFAELLGVENFKASSGWLHAFKTRNEIYWKANSAETLLQPYTKNDKNANILTEEEIIAFVKSECGPNVKTIVAISPCCLCKTNSAKLVSLNDDTEQNVRAIVIRNFSFINLDTNDDQVCKDCWRLLHEFHSLSLRIQQAHKDELPFMEFSNIEEKTIKMEEIVAETIKIEPLDYLETDETFKDEFVLDLVKQQEQEIINGEIDYSSSSSSEVPTHVPPEAKKEGLNKLVDVYDRTIKEFAIIRCSFCKIAFETFGDMTRHTKEIHNEEGFIECCGRKYHKRWVLFNHVSQHFNPKNVFTCDLCQKTFRYKRSLKDHIITRHKRLEDRPYSCEQCEMRYASKSLLKTHFDLKHNETEQGPHICPICGKTKASKFSLKNHMIVHDTSVSFICEICCKGFKRLSCLKEHMKKHTKVKKQCDLCGVWVRCLRNHRMGHEQLQLKCKECDKIFKTRAAIRAHVAYQHRTKRVLQCTFCEKKFKLQKNLREHIAGHTGERLYDCPHCPAKFNSNANMYRHRKLCAEKHKNAQ